jgi:hypothetical protein
MSNEKKENKNWHEEYLKCRVNPYYFYTQYFLINGEKAKTHMTEEQFNNLTKHLIK